jgi:hypothetical protein
MDWLKKLLAKLCVKKSKVDWESQKYGVAKADDEQLDKLNGQL